MKGGVPQWLKIGGLFIAILAGLTDFSCGAELPGPPVQAFASTANKQLSDILPAAKWKHLEQSVDRGLAWIAAGQQSDGSFPTAAPGQPAITSFCVLAFLSRGHQPGVGPYGEQLNHAIDFVISCQRPDGLFSYMTPEPQHITARPSATAAYNHAIAGLMLGEVYGHVTGDRAKAVKQAIENALSFTRVLQTRPKDHAVDRGGWRYLRFKGGGEPDSDMSVTGWQLMFLRSAKNAEFAVPQGYVDEAMAYVHRCFDAKSGVFSYTLTENGAHMNTSRGMTAAGVLSLSMAGQHQTPMALAAGDWLLAHPYRNFGESTGGSDRYYYSCYYCSQAAVQLGGRYWEGIFPPLADSLLGAQQSDGSWPPEPNRGDVIYGNYYTTALAILSLTPPYQLLPVYQK